MVSVKIYIGSMVTLFRMIKEYSCVFENNLLFRQVKQSDLYSDTQMYSFSIWRPT